MESLILALPALGYVLLQFIAVDRLRGAWRRASYILAIGIAFLAATSVFAQLSGWDAAQAGLALAVPLGLIGLSVLLTLSVAFDLLGRDS